MSKFNVGDKVKVEFETVVSEAHDGQNFFWVNRENGLGESLISDDWATKVLPALPTVEGSVIKITKWAGLDKTNRGWNALLRQGGRWAFSCDRDTHFGEAELTESLRLGNFEFEVMFDAGSEVSK